MDQTAHTLPSPRLFQALKSSAADSLKSRSYFPFLHSFDNRLNRVMSCDAWLSPPPQYLPEATSDIPFHFASPEVVRAPSMIQDGAGSTE